MKTRQIIGCIFMIIMSVICIALTVIIPVFYVTNPKQIADFMLTTKYITDTEAELEAQLSNYLPEKKVEQFINEINVVSQIKELARAVSSDLVNETLETIKSEIKQEIINILKDDDASESSKVSFSIVISNVYAKTIFPYEKISSSFEIYAKYENKIALIFAIMFIMAVAMYVYLARGRKTYKWAIIALYNVVIIISILLCLTYAITKDIAIGDVRTTLLINSLLGQAMITVILEISVLVVIALLSNYFAYFKKNKH